MKRPSLLVFPLLALFPLTACPAQMTSAAKTAEPPAPTAMASTCEQARLALDPGAVVAVVDGEPVHAKDLGPELAAAEAEAHRAYCATVSRARQAALERKVSEVLVTRAAKAEGKSVDEYVRARMEAAVGEPSDEEIQAFYDERARPGAPPLEQVRDQVIAAIQRERAEAAFDGMIAELRKGAKVEERLPDVRPPALDVDIPAHTATAGPEDAVVEVVEFADFECPYCKIAASSLKQVKERFAGKKVRFAFRHFPLSFHPNARRAAEFSQCANDQGKFWEMHDKVFAHMDRLDEASLRGYAQEVGLDLGALDQCLASGKASREVQADLDKATALGVDGTPTFFINGRKLEKSPTPEALTRAIEAELGTGA